MSTDRRPLGLHFSESAAVDRAVPDDAVPRLLPAERSPFLEPAAAPAAAVPVREGVPGGRRKLGRGFLAEKD
ncbi:hypothetical protein [Kitasatospora cheerisanensis]|nr:hypothetical protein [Kitasatospora cheerisanensis]